MTPSRTRTVAYIRVSTEQQADHGVSLEAQRAKIEQYAALFELELIAIEVDAGVSAKSLDRPGLQRALEHLATFRAEALLVVKLDRLTRSVRDLCTLIDDYFRDGGYRLMSVGENVDTRTATGRMVLSILATVSQWEREAAAERTAAVMQHLKREGRFCGGWPPYGFRLNDEGELVPNDLERAVMVTAKSMHLQGFSLRAIAAELGPNARTGKPFAASQVQRMIAEPDALEGV
jgi:DNA invertase Pin-like site-specific DNA recombinase